MKTSHIVGVVVLIIIAVFAVTFFAREAAAPVPEESEEIVEMEETNNEIEEDMRSVVVDTEEISGEPVVQSTKNDDDPMPDSKLYKVVTYTDEGFSPILLTVERGDIVFFLNKSSDFMWLSGDAASCEGEEKGMKFDACGNIAVKNGWTYTFNEAGTFNYIDRNDAQFVGTVVVN